MRSISPRRESRLSFSPFLGGSLLLLAACGSEPGDISRDAVAFDAINEEASISLVGTEPFWGIEIEPENGGYNATFSSAEDISERPFGVTRFAGNNGLGFTGELDGRTVQVALTPGACSDGMSDRLFPYVAFVELGDSTLMGCAYTSDEPFSDGGE